MFDAVDTRAAPRVRCHTSLPIAAMMLPPLLRHTLTRAMLL